MADLFPTAAADVVAELRREIAMRRRVYPRLVEQGRLTREAMDRRIALMERAVEILERTEI